MPGIVAALPAVQLDKLGRPEPVKAPQPLWGTGDHQVYGHQPSTMKTNERGVWSVPGSGPKGLLGRDM